MNSKNDVLLTNPPPLTSKNSTKPKSGATQELKSSTLTPSAKAHYSASAPSTNTEPTATKTSSSSPAAIPACLSFQALPFSVF